MTATRSSAAEAIKSKAPAKRRHPRSAQPADVDLGIRIKDARRKLGISQEALAGALGVSFQQMQKYEKGKNRISASRLQILAKALDTSPTDLMPAQSMTAVTSLIDVSDRNALRLIRSFSRTSNITAKRKFVEFVEAIAASQK